MVDLVGGDWLPWILNFPIHIGNVIIPIDALIFFRGVAQPVVTGCHQFYFPIYWEESSQLTNIFHRGSIHQPETIGKKSMTFLLGESIQRVKIQLFQLAFFSIAVNVYRKGMMECCCAFPPQNSMCLFCWGLLNPSPGACLGPPMLLFFVQWMASVLTKAAGCFKPSGSGCGWRLFKASFTHPGSWFGTISYFSIVNNHPNWRPHMFSEGRLNHQPAYMFYGCSC